MDLDLNLSCRFLTSTITLHPIILTTIITYFRLLVESFSLMMKNYFYVYRLNYASFLVSTNLFYLCYPCCTVWFFSLSLNLIWAWVDDIKFCCEGPRDLLRCMVEMQGKIVIQTEGRKYKEQNSATKRKKYSNCSICQYRAVVNNHSDVLF